MGMRMEMCKWVERGARWPGEFLYDQSAQTISGCAECWTRRNCVKHLQINIHSKNLSPPISPYTADTLQPKQSARGIAPEYPPNLHSSGAYPATIGKRYRQHKHGTLNSHLAISSHRHISSARYVLSFFSKPCHQPCSSALQSVTSQHKQSHTNITHLPPTTT